MLLPTWIDNIALRWHIIKRKYRHGYHQDLGNGDGNDEEIM